MLVARTLERCRTSPENAASVARALVAAEADGLKGHGLSRVPSYAAQAKVGKVDGFATPRFATASRAGACRCGGGICLSGPRRGAPLLVEAAEARASRRGGPPIASLRCSRHRRGARGGGARRALLRQHAAAIAPWGGSAGSSAPTRSPSRARFPIGAARGRSFAVEGGARQYSRREAEGRTIPEGWALDAAGQPTTDPMRRWRNDGADRRSEGHGACADGGASRGRPHRRELCERGLVLSRRRRAAAWNRPAHYRFRSHGDRR